MGCFMFRCAYYCYQIKSSAGTVARLLYEYCIVFGFVNTTNAGTAHQWRPYNFSLSNFLLCFIYREPVWPSGKALGW